MLALSDMNALGRGRSIDSVHIFIHSWYNVSKRDREVTGDDRHDKHDQANAADLA